MTKAWRFSWAYAACSFTIFATISLCVFFCYVVFVLRRRQRQQRSVESVFQQRHQQRQQRMQDRRVYAENMRALFLFLQSDITTLNTTAIPPAAPAANPFSGPASGAT
ncbi:hypothetical protein DQ04_21681000, partial [Trypanosoma grayi]|uniref:hypothetical protein n=1 Tax=Trypanosoma grayi TaxID=71804 RepID=UPI0004F488D2